MKRNAFTADKAGVISHFEPQFIPGGDRDTLRFRYWQETETESQGGSICLSPTITMDALLSLQQIIQGELVCRAEEGHML